MHKSYIYTIAFSSIGCNMVCAYTTKLVEGGLLTPTMRYVKELCLPMAFSIEAAARAQVPQILANSGSAKAFAKRLMIQGVLDVLEQQQGRATACQPRIVDLLEQQGRAAGLQDAQIEPILDQLGVNVLYTPLNSPLAMVNLIAIMQDTKTMTTCFIFGNAVTRLCRPAMPAMMCMISNGMLLVPIPT
ncbi:hypothetical protein KIN20_007542 [Parelaphostrongylus tenuis]|uniref:Uncharacterized protein n=1 Tax=Parelaphostrongylus tenuis TaxID=148309 RepID=A0AAD5QJ93_PARTN|nr:hypothetical protein KIN20_007542 [Parelaphostrongylus tenuis]